MLPHPLTNFEIQKYYENETRFTGVHSRNNLPEKIKDGTYVISLDKYFDSFGVNMFLRRLKNLSGIKHNS